MAESQNDALQRAYELVEAGQPEEARAILRELIETEPNNADVLWVYAYAVEDPEEARTVLQRLLEVDPEYPEAAELLKSLNNQFPVAPPLPVDLPPFEDAQTTAPAVEGLAEPDFLPPPDTAIPALPTTPTRGGRRNRTILIGLGAALIAVVLLWLVLRPPPPAPQVADMPTAAQESLATEVIEAVATEQITLSASSATEDATPAETAAPSETPVPPQVTPTSAEVVLVVTPLATEAASAQSVDATPTQEVLEEETPEGSGGGGDSGTPDATDPLAALSAALDAAGVEGYLVRLEITDLGNTVVTRICSEEGPRLRETLRAVLNAAAGITSQIGGFDALSAEVFSCAQPERIVRLIGVDRGAAEGYASGALSQESYEGQWRPY
jgi:hypothetical protein